jgi:hypothetical protein
MWEPLQNMVDNYTLGIEIAFARTIIIYVLIGYLAVAYNWPLYPVGIVITCYECLCFITKRRWGASKLSKQNILNKQLTKLKRKFKSAK